MSNSNKTIYKYLQLALFFIVISANISAQERQNDFRKNALYFEGLGQGLLYSLNYDYRIRQNISLRAGFTHWSLNPLFLLTTGKLSYTSFPIMINYLTGKKDNLFELGGGIMPAFVSLDGTEIFWGSEIKEKGSTILGTATVGYRYQPLAGGLMGRIGLTPIFTFDKFIIYFGFSLGYSF
jgi:hypothetical protein